jgi:phospholipid/cholesterol/gamma-HCH transport system permease protein
LGGIVGFSARAVWASRRAPYFVHETLRQMYEMGSRCLVPVVAVVVPMGAIVALQGLIIFRIFGLERLLSGLLFTSVFREIAPGVASMMVASQAGSSMAAELGTMRVKGEIDAQEVMAVNPLQNLIMPRLITGTVMNPLLTVVGCVLGIVGGWLVAVPLRGVNHGAFMANLYSLVTMADVYQGLTKAVIFGAIISMISCYHGFHATGGAEGVGRAANRAVVQAVITLAIVNYFVSSAFFAFVGPH